MSGNRRWLTIFLIGMIWTITAIPVAALISTGYYNNIATIPGSYLTWELASIFLAFIVAGFIFASLLTSIVLRLYDSGKLQAGVSRRQRIEKLLSNLEDHDLKSLRDRLMRYEDDGADGEYESLEALLSQQKKKRQSKDYTEE